jgi:hypothetical protein
MKTTKHVALRRRLAAPAVIVAVGSIALVGCGTHHTTHIATNTGYPLPNYTTSTTIRVPLRVTTGGPIYTNSPMPVTIHSDPPLPPGCDAC